MTKSDSDREFRDYFNKLACKKLQLVEKKEEKKRKKIGKRVKFKGFKTKSKQFWRRVEGQQGKIYKKYKLKNERKTEKKKFLRKQVDEFFQY